MKKISSMIALMAILSTTLSSGIISAATATSNTASTPASGVIIPAYFDPSTHPSDWTAINTLATKGTPTIAIANPNSGPGKKALASYTNAITSLHASGGKVIGYVSTRYGARSASAVLADINKWNSFYKIDGIFLDEMASNPTTTKLNYYKNLYASIKAINSNWTVVGNPGTLTDPKFFAYTDIMVTFELGQSDYLGSIGTENNMTSVPTSSQATLVYEVTDLAAVRKAALSRNAGWIYFTARTLASDPWARLDSTMFP